MKQFTQNYNGTAKGSSSLTVEDPTGTILFTGAVKANGSYSQTYTYKDAFIEGKYLLKTTSTSNVLVSTVVLNYIKPTSILYKYDEDNKVLNIKLVLPNYDDDYIIPVGIYTYSEKLIYTLILTSSNNYSIDIPIENTTNYEMYAKSFATIFNTELVAEVEGMYIKHAKESYVDAGLLKKLDRPTNGLNTSDYLVRGDNSVIPKSDLDKNFSNTDFVITSNRLHTGTNTVEFGFPFTVSNATVKYTNIANKSAVSTATNFVVQDSVTKEIGYADDVLPALTETMKKATDAEKDAWRLANQKSNEANYSMKPLITMVDVVTIPNGIDYNINVNILGVNLNMVQTVNIVRVKNVNGAPVVEESVNIPTFTRVSATLITVSIPPHILENGWVVMEVTDNFISSSRSEKLELTNTVKPITPPIINSWEYIGPSDRDKSRDVVDGNKVSVKVGTVVDKGVLNRAKYKTDFKITLDMINNGFEVTIKTTGTTTPVYPQVGQYVPVPSLSVIDSDNKYIFQMDRNITNWNYYNRGDININGKNYVAIPNTETNVPTAMTQLVNSTYTIKFKDGVMSLVAIRNENTTPHFKSPPIYVPISANVIANGLFICLDLADNHAGAISAEVIDFKILDY